MKVSVIGKTDATITLNKCATYVRGRVEAIVDVTNDDQRRELSGLERAGFIVVIDKDEQDEILELKPPRREPTEQERAIRSEAETQRMGSRVVIGTGNGTVESRMVRMATDGQESPATKESVEALKKLEEEEKGDDLVVNESKLDDSQQMGRKAVVSNGGEAGKVDLVNSVLPGHKSIKNSDPFIDRKENKEVEDAKKSQKTNIPSVAITDEKVELVGDDASLLESDNLFIGGEEETAEKKDDDPFIEM